MPPQRFTKWQAVLSVCFVLGFSSTACEKPFPPAAPSPTPVFHFIPYQTPTSSPTFRLPTPKTTRTTTFTPTSTPFLHSIVKDDTLLGIAFKYGVTLDELLVANPGINPQLLIIGHTIIIPMEGQPLATAPTATPIPLQIGKPVCYLTADEGAWCFALVTNSSSQDVENVSGWIGLNTSQEENKAGQIAYAPLNLLSAGQTMPLVTFMPPPLPVQFDAYATILTALPVQEADLRYLPARLNIIENSLSPDGKSGRSRGKIKIPASSPPANTAWVLVVAYAQDGQVAGVRKWEAGTQGTCAGFASTATAYPTEASTPWGGLAKECLSFDTTVYSLGPIITHLEVFVEARH